MTTILDRVIHPTDRYALFIDGANLYSTAKGLAFDIDYRKLLDEFRKHGRLIRAYYYTALVEEQDFSPIRPLVDWLDYNGYTLVTKPAREFTDANGRRRFKGDMDVEITVDLLQASAFADHVILFSGDGDFVPVVEALMRKGVRVSVVSTIKSNPPMIADDLRRAADTFIDIVDLANLIGRPPRERPAASGGRYEDDEDYDEESA
ncbi:MAG: NYN domain-containing protein [Terricaulis silvestris]